MFWPEKTMCPRRGTWSNNFFKKLERRDFGQNPSFLISLSRLLRLGKIFSGHHSNIYEITSLDRCSDLEKTMCPKRGTRSNNFFKKLERRDFVQNPSFLISLSRLLRLGIFVSGHQSTTHEITSLDRCSDPKKPCAPNEEPGQIIFSKN